MTSRGYLAISGSLMTDRTSLVVVTEFIDGYGYHCEWSYVSLNSGIRHVFLMMKFALFLESVVWGEVASGPTL